MFYAGGMRLVEYSLWLLPSRGGRKPYASSWKMTAEEAAQHGALSLVPGTTEVRVLPETEAEIQRAQANYQSAGRDAVKPPSRSPE